MSIPVGIQLFGVRDSLEKDFEGTLRALAEMGYSGVELYDFCGKTPEQFKETCDKYGLKIMSIHGGMGRCHDMIDETIEMMQKVGGKYVTLAYLMPDTQAGEENFSSNVEKLKLSGKKLHENGMQLLFHNHDGDFVKHEGKYRLMHLLDSFEDDLLLPQFDVCWVASVGINPAELMRSFKGRCPLIHLKDYYCDRLYEPAPDGARPEGFEIRPVGYGCQNIPAILDAAEECGTEWLIIEQDSTSMGLDELGCARLSREWLKQLGW